MKKVMAFQGSPRKNGNTSQLLQNALKGSKDAGAETELVQISSLHMTGCIGCYTCKKKGESYGRCILKDDMTPLYEKIDNADAVLFGSPVYMCAMTPELKMVIDRLFPYLTMDLGSLLKKNKRSALIFTQNQKDASLFEWHFNMTGFMLNSLGFEKPEILVSSNTIGYQESDVPGLVGSNVLQMHKEKLDYRMTAWKNDMEKAYSIGQNLAR